MQTPVTTLFVVYSGLVVGLGLVVCGLFFFSLIDMSIKYLISYLGFTVPPVQVYRAG